MKTKGTATVKTRITELLGIEAPVVQGAMARIADASLAGAVSEAGGLGIIACGGAPLAWVEEQVRIARSMTDKPIGANVMLMDPNAGETAELLAKLRVDVITTGAGSPANYLQMWKDAGIKAVSYTHLPAAPGRCAPRRPAGRAGAARCRPRARHARGPLRGGRALRRGGARGCAHTLRHLHHALRPSGRAGRLARARSHHRVPHAPHRGHRRGGGGHRAGGRRGGGRGPHRGASQAGDGVLGRCARRGARRRACLLYTSRCV